MTEHFGLRGRTTFGLLAAALLMASVSQAQTPIAPQVTITFNSLGGQSGDFFSSYAESGFNVALISGQACVAQDFGNPVPDLYGGPSCLIANPSSVLRITRIDAGSFWFYGADMTSEMFSSTFLFTGRTGSTVRYTTPGVIAATDDFVFYANSASNINITSLDIALNAGAAISYNIDNLRLATVVITPEPASFVLLGVGLLSVIATRRKRRFV